MIDNVCLCFHWIIIEEIFGILRYCIQLELILRSKIEELFSRIISSFLLVIALSFFRALVFVFYNRKKMCACEIEFYIEFSNIATRINRIVARRLLHLMRIIMYSRLSRSSYNLMMQMHRRRRRVCFSRDFSRALINLPAIKSHSFNMLVELNTSSSLLISAFKCSYL